MQQVSWSYDPTTTVQICRVVLIINPKYNNTMYAKQIIINKNDVVMAAIDLPKATKVSSTDNQSTRLLNLEDYEATRLQIFLSMLDYDAEVIPSVHEHKSHLVLIAFNSNKFGLDIRLSVIP